jgi:hypothetical protein
MKCPSCGAAAPEGAPECAACGVIFAKFEEKRRREREEAQAALARLNLPPTPELDPHLGRRVAIVVGAAWAAVMGFFIVKELIRKNQREAAARARFAAPVAAAAMPPAAPPAAPSAAPALPAHAVIADPSGQFTTPSGETVSDHRP